MLISFVLLLGLSACGSSEKVVATIGKTKISQAMLDHWMGSVAGSDYHATFNTTAPLGLVSDPPRYGRCVQAAASFAPKVAGKPKLNHAQLLVKCKQLDAAVKEQALSYILSVLWRTEEGEELGSPVTQAQISAQLAKLIRSNYHSPAEFRQMLADQHRTLADERFLLKRNMLEQRFLQRMNARVAKLGGGQQTFGKLVLANNAKWKAKTSCSPGYRAWQCKQANFSPDDPASPDSGPTVGIVLETLSRGEA
jgi:hypothetical protein